MLILTVLLQQKYLETWKISSLRNSQIPKRYKANNLNDVLQQACKCASDSDVEVTITRERTLST